MYCEECGAQLPDDSKFCESCGAQALPHAPAGVIGQPGAPTRMPGVGAAKTGVPSRTLPRGPAIRPTGAARARIAMPASITGRSLASWLILLSVLVCGVLVLISTFLPWVTAGSAGGVSGWYGMIHPGESAIFLFAWGDGAFFFSGFWSLILGIGLIVCSFLMFLEWDKSRVLCISLGAGGLLVALVDIVMVYAKIRGMLGYPVHAGAGLWIMFLFAAGAITAGILSYVYE